MLECKNVPFTTKRSSLGSMLLFFFNTFIYLFSSFFFTITPTRGHYCNHFPPFVFSSSEGGGGPGDLEQQGQLAGAPQEAAEGADGLHRPPARAARAQLREAEVSERAGPHGARGFPQPHGHAGQNLVPEPEVKAQGTRINKEQEM